ncbi:MAG: P-loop NTPase [Clostridia bacterium]|nr:P-loop NTPase [Clostridia bacterium]
MAEKIVVASGKGGVGKSTCVVGVATALAQMDKKVLAVDFDVSLPSLDVIFGVENEVVYNWGDILLSRCEKEDAIIAVNGVDLLCAPKKDEGFSQETVAGMIDSFDEGYDYILMDAPAGLGKFFRIASACADRGIVVSNPEDVCVRSAGVAASEMRTLGLSDVRLIINKMITKLSAGKKNLNVDSVIDETMVRLIGVVPFDGEIALVSMGKNGFSLRKKPQRSFERIAERITGKEVRLKFIK